MSHRLPVGRLVALTIWFVVLWLMLWTDLSVANLLSGLALALVVVWVTRRIPDRVDDGTVRVSPLALVVFAGHVIWQLVRANLALAWEIITPNSTIAVGTVDVPLRSDAPIVAMAVSNVVTLTPGTVTVGIDLSVPSLTIGVLRLHDPSDVLESVRHTEALAIRAFGTTRAREALTGVGS